MIAACIDSNAEVKLKERNHYAKNGAGSLHTGVETVSRPLGVDCMPPSPMVVASISTGQIWYPAFSTDGTISHL